MDGIKRAGCQWASGEPGVDVFRARKGEGRGEFVLPKKGSRRSRRVGGVPVSLRHNRAVSKRVDRITEDLARELMAGIEAALR